MHVLPPRPFTMAAAGEDPLLELFTKLDAHLGSNERKKALRILDSSEHAAGFGN